MAMTSRRRPRRGGEMSTENRYENRLFMGRGEIMRNNARCTRTGRLWGRVGRSWRPSGLDGRRPRRGARPSQRRSELRVVSCGARRSLSHSLVSLVEARAHVSPCTASRTCAIARTAASRIALTARCALNGRPRISADRIFFIFRAWWIYRRIFRRQI